MKQKDTIVSEASENGYSSTLRGFVVVVLAYIVAGVGAVITGMVFGESHPIIIAGFADIIATCIVFFFSVIVNNSSMYDPYWSVAPLFIAVFWFFNALNTAQPVETNIPFVRVIIVLLIVFVWGGRLTYNWAHQWTGLGHEDWRYVNFRKNSGKLYWGVSFLGIHLFPTLIVFGGCLALYPAMTRFDRPFSTIDIAAILMTGGAILLESFSDKQLFEFRKTRKSTDELCRNGLWKYSRHPNYLGEILFWWGIFLFGFSADPGFLWTIAGPICITLLFLFISIPMMEDRELKRKPNYSEYQKRTSRLIPWIPKE